MSKSPDGPPHRINVPIVRLLIKPRAPGPVESPLWKENLDKIFNSVFSPSPVLPSCPPRLCPLSFGEGVEFDPLPPKEIRYTSSVKYDSEKHFIDDIYMPVGLSISSCSQTVICVPNCTWRNYKAEVHLEPRNKPQRFTSTTIVYPKHAKTVYTTTLDYNCRKTTRRFLSSIELETSEYLGSDCVLDGC
ncbi:PREDICTED: filamin-interacting protein FAM101B [Aptenodytes forsteri]|nr:PREDICTED: filamin-interacting protein FAM101B [Aptenodytes forsteri]